MPKLIVALDGVVIKEVQLTKDRTTLGRRPYNDIVIDNLAVSGEHAVLEMGQGGVTLEDLGSTNGTYVNGRSVRRHGLQHNDTIEIGKYKVKFLNEAADTQFEKTMLVRPAPAEPAVPPPPLLEPHTQTPAQTAPQPTQPMDLDDFTAPPQAVLKLLSGPAAGREVALVKAVTTLGRAGVAVAAITRRPRGFVLGHVSGDPAPLLNGVAVQGEAVALHSGDILELAGTRMQFVHV